jgi:cysteine desulfurase/selenocysteine lyase
VRLLGRAADRVSVVSFTLDGVGPEAVAKYLDRTAGIAVRVGHLSAQPLVRKYGVEGAVRASFAAYSTPAEARTLVEAVGQCVRAKGGR